MMDNPKLLQMLNQGEVFFAPAVWNPPTARLARHLGFKALYLPGTGTGIALGDGEGLTTLTQTVTVADRVLEGIQRELPVIVDALSGFGGVNHVRSTVRALEDAGVSAIHIGDKSNPEFVASATSNPPSVTVDQYQQRIEHSVKARKSSNFLIIACIDARSSSGPSRDDVVKRARAALEAGANAIFVSNMNARSDDLQFYRAQIKDIPLATEPCSGDNWFMRSDGQLLSLDDYKGLGYQLILYERVIQPSLLAIHDVYSSVKDGGYLPEVPEGQDEKAHSIMWKVVGMEEKWAVEAETTESDQM